MIFRLLLLFQFSFSLFACETPFTHCLKKISDSHSIEDGTLCVVVRNHQRILFSRTTPDRVILKYDPFLSLYLIEDKMHFPYPFIFNNKLKLHSALFTPKELKEGTLVAKQFGLGSFGKYSISFSGVGVILNSCCLLEGIMTPRGVIENAYIQHFLSTKKAFYGDIGIRVKESKKGEILVSASDPFFKDNPFYKGDSILFYDGKKVEDGALFMQKILFSSLGSSHSVKIKRGKQIVKFHVKTAKRYGGGYLSDTFLERRGIFFDERLHFTHINGKFSKYGIKVGDRLEAIDGVTLKNQKELREYLENYKDYSSMRLERNNFEFFVNLK